MREARGRQNIHCSSESRVSVAIVDVKLRCLEATILPLMCGGTSASKQFNPLVNLQMNNVACVSNLCNEIYSRWIMLKTSSCGTFVCHVSKSKAITRTCKTNKCKGYMECLVATRFVILKTSSCSKLSALGACSCTNRLTRAEAIRDQAKEVATVQNDASLVSP